jgi:Cu-processing system permease protein
MLRSLAAIVHTGILEMIRRRFYVNALAAGGLMLCAALALDSLSGGETGLILVDVGLAFIALVTAVVSVAGTISTVGRDIETRQAIQILARPIPRSLFLFGRWLTLSFVAVLTNAVLGLMLSIMVIVMGDASLALRIIVAAVLASFEAFILIAFAMLFIAGSSTTLSASLTAIVFIVGRLDEELALLVAKNAFGSATDVLRVVARMTPQLSRFDMTAWVSDGSAVVLLGYPTIYGSLYAGAIVVAAVWRFNRLDLT